MQGQQTQHIAGPVVLFTRPPQWSAGFMNTRLLDLCSGPQTHQLLEMLTGSPDTRQPPEAVTGSPKLASALKGSLAPAGTHQIPETVTGSPDTHWHPEMLIVFPNSPAAHGKEFHHGFGCEVSSEVTSPARKQDEKRDLERTC